MDSIEECFFEKLFSEHKPHLFLHGPGGCGKTYFLQTQILFKLQEKSIPYVITSTTGVSACSIQGTTIHKFLGYGRETIGKDGEIHLDKWVARVLNKTNKGILKRILETDILIIDEVSMLGSNFFDSMNIFLKNIRKKSEPLGGIQCIFLGDLYQLPPVKDGYIFESSVWNELKIVIFEMKGSKRFTDMHYAEILERVRVNKLDIDDYNDLELRHVAHQEQEWKKFEPMKPTVLYSRKMNVEQYNETFLNKCDPTSEKIYYSTLIFSDKKNVITIQNKEEKVEMPVSTIVEKKQANLMDFFKKGKMTAITNLEKEAILQSDRKEMLENKIEEESKIKKIKDDIQTSIQEKIPQKIRLRINAQVMLTINLNVEKGLVNGSRGFIESFEQENGMGLFYPMVQWMNGLKTLLTPFTWKFDDVIFDYQVVQLPIQLAWCMTIHKSQGLTLDFVVCSLGNDIFLPHQIYVALSRVKSLDGLYLESWNAKKIKVDRRVDQFLKTLKTLKKIKI